jgi:hypothetical protein
MDKSDDILKIVKGSQSKLKKVPCFGNRRRTFISYKWEDETRNAWVEQLALDLKERGLRVNLDRWDVRFGDSLTEYMSKNIKKADVILFIITNASVSAVESNSKSNPLKFEVQISTARKLAGDKVRTIGIFREGEKLPTHLKDLKYVDFRNDGLYAKNLRELIHDIAEFYPLPVWLPRNLPPILMTNVFLKSVLNDFFKVKPNENLAVIDYGSDKRPIVNVARGRWYGFTGGMWLEIDGLKVHGEYDWGEKRTVGTIDGTLHGNIIEFDWYWKSSEKSGNGFFLITEYLYQTSEQAIFRNESRQALLGCWFHDRDCVDIKQVLSGELDTLTNIWIYFRDKAGIYLGGR